ncbi:MAG: hypothetical protein WCR67_05555 [Bacilli bacterium]
MNNKEFLDENYLDFSSLDDSFLTKPFDSLSFEEKQLCLFSHFQKAYQDGDEEKMTELRKQYNSLMEKQ